jgi:hypothetical protein
MCLRSAVSVAVEGARVEAAVSERQAVVAEIAVAVAHSAVAAAAVANDRSRAECNLAYLSGVPLAVAMRPDRSTAILPGAVRLRECVRHRAAQYANRIVRRIVAPCGLSRPNVE